MSFLCSYIALALKVVLQKYILKTCFCHNIVVSCSDFSLVLKSYMSCLRTTLANNSSMDSPRIHKLVISVDNNRDEGNEGTLIEHHL